MEGRYILLPTNMISHVKLRKIFKIPVMSYKNLMNNGNNGKKYSKNGQQTNRLNISCGGDKQKIS